MFTLRQILDKIREYDLQTHDPFERNDLWKIMIERGFPAKLTRAMLDEAKTSVRIVDQTSEARWMD